MAGHVTRFIRLNVPMLYCHTIRRQGQRIPEAWNHQTLYTCRRNIKSLNQHHHVFIQCSAIHTSQVLAKKGEIDYCIIYLLNSTADVESGFCEWTVVVALAFAFTTRWFSNYEFHLILWSPDKWSLDYLWLHFCWGHIVILLKYHRVQVSCKVYMSKYLDSVIKNFNQKVNDP